MSTLDASLLQYLTPMEQQELEALLNAPTTPDFEGILFPEQECFINDPSRLKGVLSTRRAGKSVAAGIYLLKTASKTPNCICVYIGLTRESAKRILWEPILKKYNALLKLNAQPNESTLTLVFPNGSRIHILGVDDSESEQEKLLGISLKLAILDEAASYTIDIEGLIEKTLRPATIDTQGTICLIGTPGDNIHCYFAKLTQNIPVSPPSHAVRDGFSIHTWSALNNPSIRDKYIEEIKLLKSNNPYIEEDPGYQQHYLGKWVSDISARVYAYSPLKNDYSKEILPQLPTRWSYTLGIDLGFNDSTALTLLAYNQHDPNTYIVYSEGKTKQTITDTANWIKQVYAQYSPSAMVVDGASKQAVQEIIQIHGIPLITAEKQDKASFIKIMNSDFIAGRIKILPGCQSLKDTYTSLIWDKKAFEKGIYKELASIENHESDAALYSYRYTYNYCYRPLNKPLTPAEKEDKREQLYLQDMRNQYNERKQMENLMGYSGAYEDETY